MPAVFLCCRDAASEKHRAFVTFGPVKSKNRLHKTKGIHNAKRGCAINAAITLPFWPRLKTQSIRIYPPVYAKRLGRQSVCRPSFQIAVLHTVKQCIHGTAALERPKQYLACAKAFKLLKRNEAMQALKLKNA